MCILNNLQFQTLIGPKSNPLSYLKKAIFQVEKQNKRKDMLWGGKVTVQDNY